MKERVGYSVDQYTKVRKKNLSNLQKGLGLFSLLSGYVTRIGVGGVIYNRYTSTCEGIWKRIISKK